MQGAPEIRLEGIRFEGFRLEGAGHAPAIVEDRGVQQPPCSERPCFEILTFSSYYALREAGDRPLHRTPAHERACESLHRRTKECKREC